jgi:hypothetical protein
MRSLTATILCVTALLGGCAGMSDTQQRALTGTTGGAAAGAVLGAIGGNAGLGAAAGAAAGLAGGLLYDRHKKTEEAAYQQGYAAARQR